MRRSPPYPPLCTARVLEVARPHADPSGSRTCPTAPTTGERRWSGRCPVTRRESTQPSPAGRCRSARPATTRRADNAAQLVLMESRRESDPPTALEVYVDLGQ